MSRVPSLKPKELLKLLLRQGLFVHHQKGSDIVLKSSIDPSKRITVPMHNKDLKIKTLLSILKQAGLTKTFLLGK